MARANPQWHTFDPARESLVIGSLQTPRSAHEQTPAAPNLGLTAQARGSQDEARHHLGQSVAMFEQAKAPRLLRKTRREHTRAYPAARPGTTHFGRRYQAACYAGETAGFLPGGPLGAALHS